MKYKLISKALEETICSKVVVDGIDYYVNDQKDKPFPHWCIQYSIDNITPTNLVKVIENGVLRRPIIATNNPNIDIPQVINEVEELGLNYCQDNIGTTYDSSDKTSFKDGYNKSQETHSFSEEDMIEFVTWVKSYKFLNGTKQESDYSKKELLALWKEQQIKTIYHN